MLEQLHADVLAHVARSTAAVDRDRMIQAVPTFRAIVADYRGRGAAALA